MNIKDLETSFLHQIVTITISWYIFTNYQITYNTYDMNDEIIENYPITPDLLQPTSVRRRWNFAKFNVGTAWKTTDRPAWLKAAQAARQTASRKGYRFAIKWHAEIESGLIVRVE